MISDDNTESLPPVTINNPDGQLVQGLADFHQSPTSSCFQTIPCSVAVQATPTQSPTDMVGGNYTWPTGYGVSPQAETDEFFNTLLSSALDGAVSNICKDKEINEDLLSRVVLGEGWNTLFNRMGPVFCPLLAVLRYLDEAALQECRPIDRLALLHAVHAMYLVSSQISLYCRKKR